MEQIVKIENSFYKISDETPEIGEEYVTKLRFSSNYDFQYIISKNYNNEIEKIFNNQNIYIFKILEQVNINEKFGIFQINKIISSNHESNSIVTERCYIPYKLDFETLEDALFYKRDLKYSENYIVKSYYI